MHPIIKTALSHLDKAQFSDCFACLQPHIPDTRHTMFHLLQDESIGGRTPDFSDRLRTFIGLIGAEIANSPALVPGFRNNLPTKEELETADLGHCLRESFTRIVLHHIYIRPKSLNLVGPQGSGKQRQLEDILTIARAQRQRAALVDIKGFRMNYEGLMQKLAHDLYLPETRFTQFQDLVDAMQHHNNGAPCLLLVTNLDTLNDYRHNDPRYNAQFVSSLNNFKNNAQVQLVCTSREWLKKVVFEQDTSILDLHRLDMPDALSDRELDAEIGRCARPMEDRHRTALRTVVRDRSDAYPFLTHLLSKVESHYDPARFDAALPTWIQHYGK